MLHLNFRTNQVDNGLHRSTGGDKQADMGRLEARQEDPLHRRSEGFPLRKQLCGGSGHCSSDQHGDTGIARHRRDFADEVGEVR